jgi:hypothetical protein
MVRVVGGEVQLDAVIIDVYARGLATRVRLEDARTLAPGQELGVELDTIDELEHLGGAERDEHGFLDAGHQRTSTRDQQVPVKWEIIRPAIPLRMVSSIIESLSLLHRGKIRGGAFA